MIKIQDLQKYFGQLHVLRGIDLQVEKGEVLSVIGASGSGKSTLLYCINGLEQIQGGTITVDGVKVHDRGTDLNKLRQSMGMVFQQWNSFPHLTAIENVALAPRIVKKKTKSEAIEIAKNQLVHVGLEDKLNVYPSELSGGQQQRLAIARALAMDPQYMLFDEATSALDNESEKVVQAALDKLSGQKTVLAVAHRLSTIQDYDLIIVLKEGEKVEEGTHDELMAAGGEYHKFYMLSQRS